MFASFCCFWRFFLMSARSGWDPEAPHPSLKEAHRWTRAAAGAGIKAAWSTSPCTKLGVGWSKGMLVVLETRLCMVVVVVAQNEKLWDILGHWPLLLSCNWLSKTRTCQMAPTKLSAIKCLPLATSPQCASWCTSHLETNREHHKIWG